VTSLNIIAGGEVEIKEFPPFLTHLSFPQLGFQTSCTIPPLPPSLTHLSLQECKRLPSLSKFTALKNLVLDTRYFETMHIENLPASIENLSIAYISVSSTLPQKIDCT
jgi:hypothetical protein